MNRWERTYQTHHWGYNPSTVIEIHDPIYPKRMVQMGRLIGLETTNGVDIEFPADGECHLGFTLPPAQRLWLVLDDEALRSFRKLWQKDGPTYRINNVAAYMGGRQAGYPYRPDHVVQVIGTLRNVIYDTHKKGDPPSLYKHHMGEEGGVKPALCLDQDGHLLIAGGSYTVPAAGITR